MASPVLHQRRSRRQFLVQAGSGLGMLLAPRAVVGAYAVSSDDALVSHYSSRPDLSPPVVAVTTSAPTVADGTIFLAPFTGPGGYGPLIVDDAGEPVWFRPSSALLAHNFRVQTLAGKPVLTWWEGKVVDGYWQGECVIADSSYTVLRRISTTFITEQHEFVITSRNTALISAINVVPADLSTYGASAGGKLIEGVFQEIDLATGKVLLDWHSSDHVDPGESYMPATDAWDYFHLNSAGVDQEGDLLVSARHTSAIYKLDRKTGKVIWHLGGKKNEFVLGQGAAFAFQHDARSHPKGLLSLFDNGAASADTAVESTSRAIVLALDTNAMTASLAQAFPNPHGSLSTAMGDMQLLPNGGWFIGWGTASELTEFSPSGAVRFDARFSGGSQSYRAFRYPWTGAPKGRPDAAASRNTNGTLDVFASWNGATEVSHWQVRGGATADALHPLTTFPRRGFETSVRLRSRPPFIDVVALDSHGRQLETSAMLAT
jgi:hypothetical protein